MQHKAQKIAFKMKKNELSKKHHSRNNFPEIDSIKNKLRGSILRLLPYAIEIELICNHLANHLVFNNRRCTSE